MNYLYTSAPLPSIHDIANFSNFLSTFVRSFFTASVFFATLHVHSIEHEFEISKLLFRIFVCFVRKSTAIPKCVTSADLHNFPSITILFFSFSRQCKHWNMLSRRWQDTLWSPMDGINERLFWFVLIGTTCAHSNLQRKDHSLSVKRANLDAHCCVYLKSPKKYIFYWQNYNVISINQEKPMIFTWLKSQCDIKSNALLNDFGCICFLSQLMDRWFLNSNISALLSAFLNGWCAATAIIFMNHIQKCYSVRWTPF